MLFYQHGFDHTSFADIAGKVGISRGNFYYHFKTKDEILDAVINRRLTNTEQMLDHWEATGEDPLVDQHQRHRAADVSDGIAERRSVDGGAAARSAP